MISRSARLFVQGAARRLGGSAAAARRAAAAPRLGIRRVLPVAGALRPATAAGRGGAAAFYSTERILELRGGRANARTVYDPSRETENCGVGLIASLKSVPSRDIIEKADEMLVRMSHRGGCGCDPASGDGSGE